MKVCLPRYQRFGVKSGRAHPDIGEAPALISEDRREKVTGE